MKVKVSELTVTINAKLDVDRKTAETCLRLVEAYVNANGVRINCTHYENGEVSFVFDEPSADAERTCETCRHIDEEIDMVDNPCWNCDSHYSEWERKDGDGNG